MLMNLYPQPCRTQILLKVHLCGHSHRPPSGGARTLLVIDTAKSCININEVRVIEHIERLCAQLQSQIAVELEGLDQAEIPFLVSRSFYDCSASYFFPQ